MTASLVVPMGFDRRRWLIRGVRVEPGPDKRDSTGLANGGFMAAGWLPAVMVDCIPQVAITW